MPEKIQRPINNLWMSVYLKGVSAHVEQNVCRQELEIYSLETECLLKLDI